MSRFEAMVESFNAGRVHDLVSSTTDDYHYSDPINGRVDGAVAHEDLMLSVLERFPDRRIEVVDCWIADGAEFAEYRWRGTPAGGSDPVEMLFAAILAFEGARLRRWANFRG
jgi:hypothetical protein